MAMYECLLLNGIEAEVYAVPGAINFPKSCADLFMGRDVILGFDNDTPGLTGMQKVKHLLVGIADSIRFVQWPKEFADGYDFRDLYKEFRKKAYARFMDFVVESLPSESTEPEASDSSESENTNASTLPNKSKTLRELEELKGKAPAVSAQRTLNAYAKHLHMTSIEPLEVMFGAARCNRLWGDPLWLFMVAPPGGMKTELLMSLSSCPLITTATSITPHTLVSGANFANGGDPSLLPKLDKRVLVIKDFTTILAMPSMARDEIFGILRDAYDGKTEKQFGNGVSRRYESKFGIIAGVTPVIEQHSMSVLGERFLKYRLPASENAGRDAIVRALNNIGQESTIRSALQTAAKAALSRGVNAAKAPRLTIDMIQKIMLLAQFVAKLRGAVCRERYTQQVMSKPCAEIGTRLAKQLGELAMGVALFKQEDKISPGTYRTIAKVACDTAPDRVEELVKQLFVNKSDEWKSTAQVADMLKFPIETVRYVLQDLLLLKIVEKHKGHMTGDWRLHPQVTSLMRTLGLYAHESAWVKRDRHAKN
jgi:hypothetical protein